MDGLRLRNGNGVWGYGVLYGASIQCYSGYGPKALKDRHPYPLAFRPLTLVDLVSARGRDTARGPFPLTIS